MDDRSIAQLRLNIMASCTAPDLLDAFEYRIRAEARAEAIRRVANVAKNWLMKKWFVMNGVKFLIPASDIESFVSDILADEPKKERGAEAVGKLVAFSRRLDGVAVTILFSDKPDMDITTGQTYAMRRAGF